MTAMDQAFAEAALVGRHGHLRLGRQRLGRSGRRRPGPRRLPGLEPARPGLRRDPDQRLDHGDRRRARLERRRPGRRLDRRRRSATSSTCRPTRPTPACPRRPIPGGGSAAACPTWPATPARPAATPSGSTAETWSSAGRVRSRRSTPGLVALLNQKLGQPVGFLNPVLYGAGAGGDPGHHRGQQRRLRGRARLGRLHRPRPDRRPAAPRRARAALEHRARRADELSVGDRSGVALEQSFEGHRIVERIGDGVGARRPAIARASSPAARSIRSTRPSSARRRPRPSPRPRRRPPSARRPPPR